MPRKLAIADGALGFWKTIEECGRKPRPTLRVHKTANVLNKMPKSRQ